MSRAPEENKIQNLQANTYSYASLAPQKFSPTAYMLIEIILQTTDKVDVFWATPIRVVTFLLLSAGALAATSPFWYLIIAIPGALILIGAALRALLATPKERDIANKIKSYVPSEEMTIKMATIDAVTGQKINELETQASLIACMLNTDEQNRYSFIAMYEIEGKRYLVQKQLDEEQAQAYREAEIRAAQIYKIEEERPVFKTPSEADNDKRNFIALKQSYLQDLLIQGTLPPKANVPWFIEPWRRFVQQWPTLSARERFDFIKGHLFEPIFNFFLTGAMVYWVIWSIAALSGHLDTIAIAALPFGSSLILLAPLGAALLYAGAKAYIAYRQRNQESSDKAAHLATSLARHTISKAVAEKASEKAHVTEEESLQIRKEILLRQILANPNLSAEDAATALRTAFTNAQIELDERTINTAVSQLNHYKINDRISLSSRVYSFIFGGDQSIKRTAAVSAAGVNTRLITYTVIRNFTGLVMFFIAAWPLIDLLTATFSVSVPHSFIVWLGCAVITGLAYAAYGYFTAKEKEKARFEKLKKFTNPNEAENALYLRLRALEDLLNEKRRSIKNLVANIIRTRRAENPVTVRGSIYNFFAPVIHLFRHFGKLIRRAFLRLRGIRPELEARNEEENDLALSCMALDDKEFMEKLNVPEKSLGMKLWDQTKMAFNRFYVFIAASGGGMFLVRLVFIASIALAGLSMVPSSLTVFTLGTFIALGVVGGIWMAMRLGMFLYKRDEFFAESLASQIGYEEVLTNSVIEAYATEKRLSLINDPSSSRTIINPLANMLTPAAKYLPLSGSINTADPLELDGMPAATAAVGRFPSANGKLGENNHNFWALTPKVIPYSQLGQRGELPQENPIIMPT